MGDGRGGLYSYDRLDMLFGYQHARSANVVLPEYQDLAVGDVIPLRAGIDPSRLYLHGNNKTEAELRYAVDSGVGHLIVELREEHRVGLPNAWHDDLPGQIMR